MALEHPVDVIDIFAPSVKPVANFNPQQDCETLHRRMKDGILIDMLCRRPWQQRVEMARTYRQLYGRDLEQEIISRTSGNFRKVLKRLLKPPTELAAFELNRAIVGFGTDEESLIEIICPASNGEISAMKAKYQEIYRRPLLSDVEGDTSGDFRRLLTAKLNTIRSETQQVDWQAATVDAHALYEAGERRMGTDQVRFNAILCGRSYAQLLAIFDVYKRDLKNDISAVIRSEFSGDVAIGLQAIVASIRNKRAYFAERLRYALTGAGTVHSMLVHIVVARCDVDLEAVKVEYQRIYARSLAKDVADHSSGSYKKALLALIGD